MQRVVILGPAGAGKSRLAAEMSRRTRLPAIHLDPIFWNAGWKPAPPEAARGQLAEAAAMERWIIDGNFLQFGASDPRFVRADTVIFLNFPRVLCIWRVLRRRVVDRRRRRPDLPDGCEEGFDWPLLKWIWNYPAVDRPQVLELLGGLPASVRVHHLRSPRDVDGFLRAPESGTEGRQCVGVAV